jgi:D-alanyl-D-alanine carboxypeptidase/D-alanyl-D-alanine-endopeptidase (penicillin-binding protein 4)
MVAVRCAVCAALLLAASGARSDGLPPEADLALQRARVPEEALSVVIREIGTDRTVLSAQAQRPVNPASVTKLLTTMAALDRLGPAWTWTTPVWLQGAIGADGVLDGSLVIKGSGDPKLVIERLWLLLRRVREMGVREIRGDIVLDSSAFAVPEGSAADFDGEGSRPYNVRPSALLLNFKSVTYSFVPDSAAGVARVIVEPALAGAVVDRSVPLAAGPCNDWPSALKATFGEPRLRWTGVYATACGEQAWSVADGQPATYNVRLLEALWQEMGGRLGGSVHEGKAPDGKPSFELHSPPLAEVIRDINKFSNNVMAQQLFYTLDLARHPGQPATTAGARETLRRWLSDKLGDLPPDLFIDNGSGLSRDTRMTVQMLARLLTLAFDSPVMPELMASLPLAGIDGTLRRMKATPGRAHLKSGSLRDVAAVAGYVISDSGRRYVLAAVIQHPNANAARAALDALVQWTVHDAPPR